MRQMSLMLVFCLFASHIFAKVLPFSTFFDTEVSTNIVLRSWNVGMKDIEFRASFIGNSSNNVEFAFGRDSNQEEDISPEEVSFSVGWDCGKWFLLDSNNSVHYLEPLDTNPSKQLSCRFKISQSGMLEQVKLSDKDNLLFEDLDEIIMASCSTNWNAMQIISRGIRNAEEEIAYESHAHGLKVFIR